MRAASPTSIVLDYQALRTGAGIADLSAWTRLRISGPDARSFLQGLATQDLEGGGGTSAQTLFLSERGRPVALAWVGFDPRDGSAWIVADEGARATLGPHFDRFHVMEDVEIEGPSDAMTLGFAGPGRGDLLRRFMAASTVESVETIIEGAAISFVLLPAAAAPPAGFTPVAPEAFEAWRLSVGLPRTGIDLDPDRIATELSLDDVISHTKGCFVGQEVVARTSNRGQVKRSRVGFRFPTADARSAGDPPIPPRSQILAGGVPVGYVTSSALEPGTGGGLGMGYLALEAQIAGARPVLLHEGSEIQIRPAPWPL